MGRLDSVRSNKSSSSSSTYIYGTHLAKKPLHRSQLSLYEKLSRKLSLFENTRQDQQAARSRKSSRQRSVSDTKDPKGTFTELNQLRIRNNKYGTIQELRSTFSQIIV